MVDWRGWAKHGVWENVNEIHVLAFSDRSEQVELKEYLKIVVPKVLIPLEGDGPLGDFRIATLADLETIEQSVDRGEYELRLRQLKNELKDWPDPDIGFAMETYISRQEHLAGGKREFQVRQLKYAANCLDIMEAGLPQPPSMDWLNRASLRALKVIEHENINFQSLDNTHVAQLSSSVLKKGSSVRKGEIDGIWHDVTSSGLPQGPEWPAVPVFPLREIAREDPRWVGSRLFHAVTILILLDEMQMRRKYLPPYENDEESWRPKEVLNLLLEVGEIAFDVGFHLGAIERKWLERPAQQVAKTTQPLDFSNKQRAEKSAPEHQRIIEQMVLYFRRDISIKRAAELTFKKDNLGTSADSNRQIYYRSLKKKL